MMRGKLLTCDCILDLDEDNHTGTFVSECEAHRDMGYTADEVLAEHVAIQMDAIQAGKPKSLFRKIKDMIYGIP